MSVTLTPLELSRTIIGISRQGKNVALLVERILNHMRIISGSLLDPVDIPEKLGKDIVKEACEAGDTATVKLLMRKGQKVNANECLASSCRNGNAELVQMFLFLSDKKNYGPNLYIACRNGHWEIFRMLIEKPDLMNEQVACLGLTGACYGNQLEMAKLLIEKFGASPDEKSFRIAASENHFEIVKYLFSQVTKDTINNTLEEIVCQQGNDEMVKLLIANGSDPKIAIGKGYKELDQLYQFD